MLYLCARPTQMFCIRCSNCTNAFYVCLCVWTGTSSAATLEKEKHVLMRKWMEKPFSWKFIFNRNGCPLSYSGKEVDCQWIFVVVMRCECTIYLPKQTYDNDTIDSNRNELRVKKKKWNSLHLVTDTQKTKCLLNRHEPSNVFTLSVNCVFNWNNKIYFHLTCSTCLLVERSCLRLSEQSAHKRK